MPRGIRQLLESVPKPLQVLVLMSNAVGVIGLIAAVILYSTYTPQAEDAQMAMSIPATGVMVGLYFFAFVLFGFLILKQKTMGFSGLVLTNVTLVIISWTISQAGQWVLAIAVFVFAVLSLAMMFNPRSLEWYKEAYTGR